MKVRYVLDAEDWFWRKLGQHLCRLGSHQYSTPYVTSTKYIYICVREGCDHVRSDEK